MSIQKKRFRIIVNGRVQGVCYRSFVKAIAKELLISGFVKNKSNGSVEIIAEGFETCLKKLGDICLIGSLGSEVKSICIKEEDYIGGFDGFDILYPPKGLIEGDEGASQNHKPYDWVINKNGNPRICFKQLKKRLKV